MVRELSLRGAKVYLLCRSEERGRDAVRDLARKVKFCLIITILFSMDVTLLECLFVNVIWHRLHQFVNLLKISKKVKNILMFIFLFRRKIN